MEKRGDKAVMGNAPVGGEGAPPQAQQAQGPDPIEQEKAAVAELERELEETTKSVDEQFIAQFMEGLTPDEAELQYADMTQLLRLYEDRKKEFVETTLAAKEAEIGKRKKGIKKEENRRYVAADREKFLAEYPDADMQALKVFMQEELPPKVVRKLQSAPSPYEFYQKLYEMYQAAQGQGQENTEGQEQEEELPVKIEDASYNATNNNAPTGSAFMRKI